MPAVSPPYSWQFTARAAADLSSLAPPVRSRLLKKLDWLAENVHRIRHQTLTGKWSGMFKLRVGDYRILYTLDHSETKIVVHRIGHRREIYTKPG